MRGHMREALALAKQGYAAGFGAVGAVIVDPVSGMPQTIAIIVMASVTSTAPVTTRTVPSCNHGDDRI